MQTTEIIVTVHRSGRVEIERPKRRVCIRKRIARLNGWTVAWYAFLTVAGVLLFKAGAAYALRERGYHAVGGEAVALLLPVLYYVVVTTIRDIVWDVKDRGNKR